ncbi:MAG: carbamoyl-phosphate synthase large subunit [Phycisphaerales bacterium]
MPKRTDIHTILIIGSGPIVIGQGCEFDYSGTQACKALRAEGYRVVLVNSNPATIMTDPEFSDRTYIEPITPESVRKIIQKQIETGDPIDAVLPTLGGQTALNCACALWDDGTFQKYNIQMIGADRRAIHRAEDRQAFKELCEGIGLKMATARTVTTLDEARAFLKQIGLPAIIRPAFTLGGSGGGIAYNQDEFEEIVTRGLRLSMIGQVLIDQSLLGWKEYELEVVRDKKDNCIVVCGIENIDPMGVHTGDSITIAPILTLTDKEYQAMRDAAFSIMRAVGVETGGSNVQFAVNPSPRPGAGGTKPFEMVVIEMNPRVSRSSALASKATGFPIAKIAAKLAVGYTLDELKNDITGVTSACFEPSIDYIVTKMPRWTFEKFPEADETLTTQMKSVGEAMAIGRTFLESFQKAIRSMEVKRFGLGLDKNDKWLAAMRAVEKQQLVLDVMGDPSTAGALTPRVAPSPTGLRTADGAPIEWPIETEKLTRKLAVPSQGRVYYIRYALKMGWSIQRISELTRIDHFFLDQIKRLVEFEDVLCAYASLDAVPREVLFRAKQLGYSDAQLANLYLGDIKTETILKVREHRQRLGIEPVYKLVDTCAAEFEAKTPYYYSTYETGIQASRDHGGGSRTPPDSPPSPSLDDEIRVSGKQKVIILGGGPNRIGQGIEFDYCCVHAAFAAKELGFEAVMINSNPETVSTDYDTSDLLFFEPLTLEDVLNVVERLGGGRRGTEALVRGLIVQFGGQTPLNLAHGLQRAGAPIIGTSVDSIDLAEDRDRFDALLTKLDLHKPPSGIARDLEQAVAIAARITYPVLVRPSYVLGGRGMEICSDEKALRHYMATAVNISELDHAPVLIDKFLDDATEVDVDVVADYSATSPGPASADGSSSIICGVMEHIEQAGIHSGDSACTIPPWSLAPATVDRIKQISRDLARELKVNGLMNVQMAIKQARPATISAGDRNSAVGHAAGEDQIYILEVNPRASRTAPFVGKATHMQWPRIAAKVMMGRSLAELGATEIDLGGAGYYAVKESVFPFGKFPGVDVVLGPEMRSTGEVMGIDSNLAVAFAKSQIAAGTNLPRAGNVFISVRERDRAALLEPATMFAAMGFGLFATDGTGNYLIEHGVPTTILQKIGSGARPNVIDLMTDGKVQLVINTPTKTGWQTDEGRIRAATIRLGVAMITTTTGALAAARAIKALREGDWGVKAMQDYRAARP